MKTAKYITLSMLGLTMMGCNDSFLDRFPEDSLSHSFYALFFSFSLVRIKIGIKRIRVPKADFKLVSIIGVPNRI